MQAALASQLRICCILQAKTDCVLQIGFFGLLIVELVAHKGILELVGIRTGAGLGFEF